MSTVAAIWRTEELEGVLTKLLTYLEAEEVVGLLQVEKSSRKSVRRLLKRYQTARSRLALASLSQQRLRIEFRTFYQELRTQNIPRSSDPRVPPRVVSIWTEKGEVDGGSMTLKPIELPNAHRDGVFARFVADAGQRPMLTNVVQRNRRIYTMVTVKLLRSDEDGGSDALVLRSYSYLKEFGEWKTPGLPEKRKLAAASIGSRRGRFDLLSLDGSVALELEVPSGTEAQMDYYLVKQAAVSLHMQELLQPHFQSIRPIRALPEPRRREICIISVTFRSMTGVIVARSRMVGYILLERQGDDDNGADQADASEDSSAGQDSPLESRLDNVQVQPRQRSGIEKFEVVTCQADCRFDRSAKVVLPREAGYAWIEVRSAIRAASRQASLYFYAVALHHGAQLVPERGGLRVLQLSWLPGVLESFPTSESRHRRCLKGSLSMVTSSYDGRVQDLELVAQRLPAERLERYAARITSYTRHEEQS